MDIARKVDGGPRGGYWKGSCRDSVYHDWDSRGGMITAAEA